MSGRSNTGDSLPSPWHSSSRGGSSSNNSSSSLFRLQQQQQQQQYRGKRSRDEERTGGAAREEGLAHVMRALCRDDCAAGDVMVGVCAAIPNGSI
eukprot:scaffold268397_cov19-Tisochrysis_lutea.AAC.1